MSKPTFKNTKREGQFKSFQLPSAEIKLDGKSVGWIQREKDSENVRVWLHLKEEGSGGGFKNTQLKHRSNSIPESKKFVTENWEKIIAMFDLHKI